jgi:hypothetical protein
MFGVVAPEIRELLNRLGFPPPIRDPLVFSLTIFFSPPSVFASLFSWHPNGRYLRDRYHSDLAANIRALTR